MRTKTISIEDAIYIERSYSFSDALRLSSDAIYQDLEHTFTFDIEVFNFRAIPVSIDEDFVTYKIYPTEYISMVFEDDPVKIYVGA
ncbi:MAG: hypothetical protein ACMV1K_13155 [Sulfurospirillum sp.]